MKFVVAFAVIVAVAVASPLVKPIDTSVSELEAIVAAIQSPSTDPATAALLEQQLAEILGAINPQPEPVVVAEDSWSPISVGPAIIDFPLPDGGAATPGLTPVVPEVPAVVEAPVVEAPVAPAPVVIGGNAQSSPLVQIIVNVQSSSAVAPAPVETPVAPAPVETPVIPVFPVNVVEDAVNVDTVVPTPVVIVDSAPEPVQVVEAPVEVEPIQVGTPILPSPVVLLPETLN